jgi:tetratricopeptide (TPR) repeat protein
MPCCYAGQRGLKHSFWVGAIPVKRPIQTVLAGFAIVTCSGLAACSQKEQMRMMLPTLDSRIKASPDDISLLTCRAYYDEQLGDSQKALADWRAVVILKPTDHDGLIDRSVAFLRLKDYPHALADTDAAIKLKSVPVDWCNRGTVHISMKQLGPAVQDYSKALQLDKNSAPAYEGFGEIEFKMNKYDAGVAYCNRALYLDSSLMDALYFRGKCYEALGKKSLADRDINAAQAGGYVPDEPFVRIERK